MDTGVLLLCLDLFGRAVKVWSLLTQLSPLSSPGVGGSATASPPVLPTATTSGIRKCHGLGSVGELKYTSLLPHFVFSFVRLLDHVCMWPNLKGLTHWMHWNKCPLPIGRALFLHTQAHRGVGHISAHTMTSLAYPKLFSQYAVQGPQHFTLPAVRHLRASPCPQFNIRKLFSVLHSACVSKEFVFIFKVRCM